MRIGKIHIHCILVYSSVNSRTYIVCNYISINNNTLIYLKLQNIWCINVLWRISLKVLYYRTVARAGWGGVVNWTCLNITFIVKYLFYTIEIKVKHKTVTVCFRFDACDVHVYVKYARNWKPHYPQIKNLKASSHWRI